MVVPTSNPCVSMGGSKRTSNLDPQRKSSRRRYGLSPDADSSKKIKSTDGVDAIDTTSINSHHQTKVRTKRNGPKLNPVAEGIEREEREGDGNANDDENIDDILRAHPHAGELNFLTGRPFSNAYREHAKKWSDLPVYKDKDKLREISHSIKENNVTIVISGTGSGKTVIVPKLALLHALGRSDGLQVAVTNPKSMVTLNNARYAALLLDTTLGKGRVGASFRGSPSDASSHGGTDTLQFVTDGYLVAQSRQDPLFSKYSVVVIDEAHERTVQIDNLLFRLRRALRQRKDFRVVIMSATIDSNLFSKYFENHEDVENPLSVGVTHVSGQSNFDVESIYIPTAGSQPVSQTMEGIMESAGLDAISRAMRRAGPGEDILFFVPTSRDAELGCRMLSDACREGKMGGSGECVKTKCSTLYSKLSKERQEDAKSVIVEEPFDRKIIFATNLAESSLTLPTLTIVIDSGLELSNTWVPRSHTYRLQRVMSTQAQIMQRMGRVGRTRPGTCYHLYSREERARQPMYPSPSILEVDITDDFLSMMREDGASFSSVCIDYSMYLTPPKPVQVAATASVLAFYRLIDFTKVENNNNKDIPVHFHAIDFDALSKCEDLRAVSKMYDGKITSLGKVALDTMKKFKLGLWNALLLVSGIVYDVGHDAAILTSILEECSSDPSALWNSTGGEEERDKRTHLTGGKKVKDRNSKNRQGQQQKHSQHSIKEIMELTQSLVDVSKQPVSHPRSEHVSIIYLYKILNRLRRGADYGRQQKDKSKDPTVIESQILNSINHSIWNKIDDRIVDTTIKLRRFEVRNIDKIVDDVPLLSLPSSVAKSNIERCIISARLYHVVVPGSFGFPLFLQTDKNSKRLKSLMGSGVSDESKYFSVFTMDTVKGKLDVTMIEHQGAPQFPAVFESTFLMGTQPNFRLISYVDVSKLENIPM